MAACPDFLRAADSSLLPLSSFDTVVQLQARTGRGTGLAAATVGGYKGAGKRSIFAEGSIIGCREWFKRNDQKQTQHDRQLLPRLLQDMCKHRHHELVMGLVAAAPNRSNVIQQWLSLCGIHSSLTTGLTTSLTTDRKPGEQIQLTTGSVRRGWRERRVERLTVISVARRLLQPVCCAHIAVPRHDHIDVFTVGDGHGVKALRRVDKAAGLLDKRDILIPDLRLIPVDGFLDQILSFSLTLGRKTSQRHRDDFTGRDICTDIAHDVIVVRLAGERTLVELSTTRVIAVLLYPTFSLHLPQRLCK